MAGSRHVAIAGGGPAGLASAIALTQAGLRCTVVDKREPPIEKACGEGMMPAGVEALAQLGIQLDASQGKPFRGIRYVDEHSTVRADFAGHQGLAVRRPVLHQAMVDRCQALGVELLWNRNIEGLTDQGLLTDSGSIHAKWVVGADGLRSPIRSWAGLDAPSPRQGLKARFGVRRHYHLAPWSDDVEVYWGDGCEAYVWGLPGEAGSQGQVGVSMLWSGRKASFDLLLQQFPELEKRLQRGTLATKDRGSGPFDQRVLRVADRHVALVGDAAGYRDAITGEGLALAFQQALALADCLGPVAKAELSQDLVQRSGASDGRASGSRAPDDGHSLTEADPRRAAALHKDPLRQYRTRVASLSRRPHRFIQLLLAIEARPRLRKRILATLASEPSAFAHMLALHDGAPLTGTACGSAFRFAGRFAFG